MPHLSPMHWVLCPMIFWTLMFMFASNLWWHQSPVFPTELVSSKTNTGQPWSWAPLPYTANLVFKQSANF